MICDIYQSNKPKNRDELIMQFVYDMRLAENGYLDTGFDTKKKLVLEQVNKELTEKERIIFDFEIYNLGV
jgi:hypothetical protein